MFSPTNPQEYRQDRYWAPTPSKEFLKRTPAAASAAKTNAKALRSTWGVEVSTFGAKKTSKLLFNFYCYCNALHTKMTKEMSHLQKDIK